MREITEQELTQALKARKEQEKRNEGRPDKTGELLGFSDCLFADMDLSGRDLHGINFDKSDFRGVDLSRANLDGCTARNAYFQTTTMHGTTFRNADLTSADFRHTDLSEADFSGANLYAAALAGADLTGLKTDEKTQFYAPRCPMEGAFIGWKVCYGRRIVQLLVPKDARRLQGTREEIRVDKAKVLTIKNEDYTEQYHDAHSYVDENFVYTAGEWISVDAYDTDRFTDSGPGIHIWMDRDAAIAYLG